MARLSPGYTIIELLVVCCVLAIIAAVTVLGFAAAHGRATSASAAVRFTLVLRDAQARAWARHETVRVVITESGHGFVVDGEPAAGDRRVETGSFGGARCQSNYPLQGVEFVPGGFPHAIGGPARAGTFTFVCGGVTRRVVVQMGGVVRCL